MSKTQRPEKNLKSPSTYGKEAYEEYRKKERMKNEERKLLSNNPNDPQKVEKVNTDEGTGKKDIEDSIKKKIDPSEGFTSEGDLS